MFKKQNFIARHNSKVAKNMGRFAKDHPQLTGASCTVGGTYLGYKVVNKIVKKKTGLSIPAHIMSRRINKFFKKVEDAVEAAANEIDDVVNTKDKTID